MTQSKSNQSLYLLHLPNEIQTRIFTLAESSSAHTIQAILLTCKHFHALALPLSVSSVQFISVHQDDGKYPGSARPLFRFLRHITFTRPNLARHVRRLVIDSFDSRDGRRLSKDEKIKYVYEESSEAPMKKERDVYKALVEELITPESTDHWEEWRQDWMTDLDDGVPDAQVALLLTACKGLSSFYFGEPYQPRLVLRVIAIAAGDESGVGDSDEPVRQAPLESSKLPLQQVQDLFHESTEGKYGYLVFDHISAPFFRLPNMRTWECLLANGEGGVKFKFRNIPRRSSNVEAIILRHSAVTSEALHAITGACRALRSFEYVHGPIHMYDTAIMPGNVMDAILPHASSFHTLYTNFQEDWDKIGWQDDKKKLYMGLNLRKMSKLKSLSTSMQALTGFLDRQPEMLFADPLPLSFEEAPRLVECLPEQSLEYLEIHSCGEAILQQAQEFLNTLGGSVPRFPKLRQARFLFNAESIAAEQVDLKSPSDAVQLDVVFQTLENRRYDLVNSYKLPWKDTGVWIKDHVHHMCTKLYDPTLQSRNLWLATRGGSLGRANEDHYVETS